MVRRALTAALSTALGLLIFAAGAQATELEGLQLSGGYTSGTPAPGSTNQFSWWFFTDSAGFTGRIVVRIPAGWSTPQKESRSIHGYVDREEKPGVCAGAEGYGPGWRIAGTGPWTITRHVQCTPDSKFRLNYGIPNGTGNVLAPERAGRYRFSVSVTTTAGTETHVDTIEVT